VKRTSDYLLGMKNLFGHWRPDLLSRCNPDIANLAKYAVGGYTNTTQGVYLVSAAICQSTDSGTLDDGFRSFPSGHSSFSAAGLVYLSLFLASKLAVAIPFLAPRAFSNHYSGYVAIPSRMVHSRTGLGHRNVESNADKVEPSSEIDTHPKPSGHDATEIAARNQAAAPPIYLLVFACVPFFTSIYISSTRYSDFRHHGFDILFGFFIGTVTAVFSFRWYQLPISQGAGWSWGPRSRDLAFWAGVGAGSYANRYADSEYSQAQTDRSGEGDLEAGPSNPPAHNSDPLADCRA
jgi:membrane-associated phospholipid phosphatase